MVGARLLHRLGLGFLDERRVVEAPREPERGSQAPIFLVDIGFSHTAGPGLVLVGNIISLPALSMTTGAMLPADRTILEDLVGQLSDRFGTTTVGQVRWLS